MKIDIFFLELIVKKRISNKFNDTTDLLYKLDFVQIDFEMRMEIVVLS